MAGKGIGRGLWELYFFIHSKKPINALWLFVLSTGFIDVIVKPILVLLLDGVGEIVRPLIQEASKTKCAPRYVCACLFYISIFSRLVISIPFSPLSHGGSVG